MPLLSRIHRDIDERAEAIRRAHPRWLCAKGCGHCCHQLAGAPRLTAPEWSLLREALTSLPEERLNGIRRAMVTLAGNPSRPVVCPLLDTLADACAVYPQRPVACRTYGFYVEREGGLYCREIDALVIDCDLADVVWGNHEVIDEQLASLGEIRPLTEWFGEWEGARQATET